MNPSTIRGELLVAQTSNATLTSTGPNGLRVTGRAVVYDRWTSTGPLGTLLARRDPKLYGKVMERIRPTALNGVDTSRVLLLAHHDMHRPLARVGAGLTLENRPDGLHFTATLPDTNESRDIVTLLKSGVLGECSFGYTIAEESVEKRDGKLWYSADKLGALYELSIVSAPAFQGTSALAATRTPRDIRRLVDGVTGTNTASTYLRTVAVSPYGPKSPHSYWVDVALTANATQGRRIPGLDAPLETRPGGWQTGFPGRINHESDNPAAARERLEAAGLTTTTTTGGEFTNPGLPAHLLSAWQKSFSAAAVVAPLIPTLPWPEGAGETLTAPQITTGVTMNAQTEASTVTNTTPVTASVSHSATTIAGNVDVSWQAWELSGNPSLDEALTIDMAAKFAAELDRQYVAGAGFASHELAGILGAAGIGITGNQSVVYTDATPTGPEFYAPFAIGWSKAYTARQLPSSALILHTKTWALISSALDTTNLHPIMDIDWAETDEAEPTPGGYMTTLPPGLRTYATPVIPQNLGGGSNETRAIILRPADHRIYTMGVQFKVSDQPLVSTGQIKLTAYAILTSFPDLAPAGTAIVSGSGMIPPASL